MIKRNYLYLLDIFLTASLVIIFTLQPYFFHGIIDYWETGVYLPAINELFHNKILFKDIMITRGPLEIYVPAFFMLVFGRHINVLTAWLYFGNVLSILFMVYIARELFKTRILLYLLVPVLVALGFPSVFSRIWGGFRFACGGLAILYALKFFNLRRPPHLFLSGLFTALGFFFSFEMGVFPFLAVCITLLIFEERTDFFKSAILYLCGSLSVVLPFLSYFLFTGGIKGFFQNIISVPRSASAAYHFDILFPDMPRDLLGVLKSSLQPFKPNFQYFLPVLIYLVLGVYLLTLFTRHRNNGRFKQCFCFGLFGLLMYFGSFRQINGPQFLVAMQPALVSFFLIMDALFVLLKNKQPMKKISIPDLSFSLIILLFIFIPSFLSIFAVKNYMAYGFDKNRVIHRQICRGCFPTSNYAGLLDIETARGILVPDWQAEEINSLVRYVRENALPEESISCFPDRGVFNFFFDRPCLGRFCQADIASFRQDWTEDFFSQLESRKPRYIIYKREVESFESLISEYPIVKNRNRIRDFINNNYIVETSISNFDVYKIKARDDKENNRKH